MVSSIDLYNRALEIDPTDYKTSLDYSFIYYESGDIEKAIKIIKDSIEEVPGESLLYYRLVIYLMDSGRYKESINMRDPYKVPEGPDLNESQESQNDIESSKSDVKWKINEFPMLYWCQRFFAGGSGGPARPPSNRQRGVLVFKVKNFQKFRNFFLVSK